MPTLTELIEEALREVLPRGPEGAINGTELIQRLKKSGNLKISEKLKDVPEGTLRAYISSLATDSTSVIAKISGKHGYYFREIEKAEEPKIGKDNQREEKFRSLFIRYNEMNSDTVAVKLDHSKTKKKERGFNKWTCPDVILVKNENINGELLKVKRTLAESIFRLSSIELKTEINSVL